MSTKSLWTALFEPKPHISPDPVKRALDTRKNQQYFSIFLGSVLIYPFLMPFTNFTTEIHISNIVINLTHTLLYLLLCRSYLWVFHLQYTLFISLAPIALMSQVKEMFFFHLGYAFVIPPFIFMMSNDYIFTLIAGSMQVYIFHTKYKELFVEHIENMGAQLFAEKFIGATTVPFVFLVILNIFGIRALHKKTTELSQSNRIAEEAIEQQKTFILSFSHELRNPLNSLLGNLQLALMEAIPIEAAEMIKTAKVCGEILLQYINNLLDTGKFEIGNLEVNATLVNVHEMFQRAWTISNEIIRRKGLTGHLKIERKVPSRLSLDAQRITQILLNLIGNAVKFTDRGKIITTVQWLNETSISDKCFEPIPYDDTDEGVFEKQENLYMLTLSNERSFSSEYLLLNKENRNFNLDEVTLPETRSKGMLKIIVKDTGCGMKNESLKKLFQKFSQVSDDPSKRQIGTGLGLFITKEVCRKMNGDIKVYSKEKVGTTFIVCIPTISVPVRSDQSHSLATIFRTLRRIKPKAIVTDDSPFNVGLLCSYFTKMGVEVVATANNGYDALKAYIDYSEKGQTINIVTLDINMPTMNGKVACRKIRQYEDDTRRVKAKIVMISGNYDETQIQECLDKDGPWKVNHFFRKPLLFVDFMKVVYKLLIEQDSENEIEPPGRLRT